LLKFVIRAGGVGTRLWPYSRQGKPKQFHAMAGQGTMLQQAVERIAPIATMDDIYVSTGAGMEELVRRQLPDLPEDHLIVEPALRNTGPAVALECALIEARTPGCTIASLGSDHYIGRPDVFNHLLQVAERAAEAHPDTLFTVGVKPTRPETGYGYIGKGDELLRDGDDGIWQVSEFTEKPDLERARQYVDSGRFLWNSNMFVWRADTVLELFQRCAPEIHRRAAAIGAAAAAGDWRDVLSREYPDMPNIAVDNAILETAPKVATLEADMNWGDIGSWAALTDVIDADDAGNLLRGRVVNVDSTGSTVYAHGDKVVALVGVEDLVVVDTEDALLVMPKDQAQRVKDVLARLQADEELRRHT
jgi:mannose-1-phosphate guanylyltransferase